MKEKEAYAILDWPNAQKATMAKTGWRSDVRLQVGFESNPRLQQSYKTASADPRAFLCTSGLG